MSTCGICGDGHMLVLFEATDLNFRSTRQVFSIEQCPACGVAQTSPRPDASALKDYYPPPYYPTVPASPGRYKRTVARYQKDKLTIVRRHRRSGRLLDVGCGAGYFVRAAMLSGYDAEGIEFSPEAASAGRAAWNLRIASGDVAAASYPSDWFDIITLWQVLEHLPHPFETLERIGQLLRPGGLLVLAVPNFASIQSRLFRQRWYHLDVPRHLYHFDPRSLRGLLTRHGFRVLEEDHHCPEHNWAGILGSVTRLSPPGMSLAGKAARRLVGRPLSRLLAGLEASLGSGGTFTLCARKPE